MSMTPPDEGGQGDPLGFGGPPPIQDTRRPVVPRPVTGQIAPELAEYVQPELRSVASPAAGASFPGRRTQFFYTGDALLDNKGNITRQAYDPVRESAGELAGLSAEDRLALLQDLYQRDFYARGVKPSASGTNPSDYNAFAELLKASNAYGYEWRTALQLIRADYPASRGGRGGRRTPVEDIRKSVDQQALSALGRKFTDDEISGLIAQIQSREAGGDRTTLSTMAEGAVAGAVPDEQQAYRFTQVVDLFNDMLRTGR
jgi:hypothetical protein